MDAILNLASCVSYTLAKAPIWGIHHIVLVLIQIIFFALDFLDFSFAVGWMALDVVALLLDAGYDAVTMTSSATPTIVASLWTTLSSPRQFASLLRKSTKTVTANVPYFAFLTIDMVENVFLVAALTFKALIITRALPLAVKAFRLCFSSVIAPVRSAKWRRAAKHNVLAFGFPILLAICSLVALLSQISPILTERRMASGILRREPGVLFNLTGMLLRSDDFNLSRDLVFNHTHMNLRYEAGKGGWSIPTFLLDNASNLWLLR